MRIVLITIFCEIGKNNVNLNCCNDNPSLVKLFLKKRRPNTIFLKPVTENEIMNIIHGLNANKASGHDKIPCFVIKRTANIITPILVSLINSAFCLGIFPNELKIAKVIPIYKKGDNSLMSNYRPISLFSCFSKIFEKALHSRLYNFIDKQSVLIPTQYGFQLGL